MFQEVHYTVKKQEGWLANGDQLLVVTLSDDLACPLLLDNINLKPAAISLFDDERCTHNGIYFCCVPCTCSGLCHNMVLIKFLKTTCTMFLTLCQIFPMAPRRHCFLSTEAQLLFLWIWGGVDGSSLHHVTDPTCGLHHVTDVSLK